MAHSVTPTNAFACAARGLLFGGRLPFDDRLSRRQIERIAKQVAAMAGIERSAARTLGSVVHELVLSTPRRRPTVAQRSLVLYQSPRTGPDSIASVRLRHVFDARQRCRVGHPASGHQGSGRSLCSIAANHGLGCSRTDRFSLQGASSRTSTWQKDEFIDASGHAGRVGSIPDLVLEKRTKRG